MIMTLAQSISVTLLEFANSFKEIVPMECFALTISATLLLENVSMRLMILLVMMVTVAHKINVTLNLEDVPTFLMIPLASPVFASSKLVMFLALMPPQTVV
jgi:hypothetical protein